MSDNYDNAALRARQYWYTDGFNEMAFGTICGVLGLYFLTQTLLSGDSLLRTLLEAGFIVIVGGTGLLAGTAVNKLKQRLTYPRTGYVAYRKGPKSRRLLMVGLTAAVSGGLAAVFAILPVWQAWMPLASAGIIGAAWVFVGIQSGLARFFVLAMVSLLAGAGLAFSGLENIPALGVYYLLMAVALFVSGGVTLYRYLHATTGPQPEE